MGTPAASWRDRISSHDGFRHDTLESLGHDWGRLADPRAAPRPPFKVYMPQSTADVVRAVREARSLGERPVVRSRGHSSNDLVVAGGGSLLLTERLNRVLSVDEHALTAAVQAGAVTAQLDARLASRGLGLPVIGDHNDITAGGFASVGGVSPASHRHGLFVDNVEWLEYVDWDGELHEVRRETDGVGDGEGSGATLYRLLTGTGQHGVITALGLRLIRVDKLRTVLESAQTFYATVGDFIAGSAQYVEHPGDAAMLRGLWLDAPLAGGQRLRRGQFSVYRETEQTAARRLADRLAHGVLHRVGYAAGRLPRAADRALKLAGTAALFLAPKYATIKNVEVFTDRILDATVGDPFRWLVALVPADSYAALFHAWYGLLEATRARHRCFTYLAAYVKPVRSAYLAQGRPDARFAELIMSTGIVPERMTGELLEELVTRLDDLCIEHGAFRYMHTRTTKDPGRRRCVDPNAFYAGRA